MRRLTGRSGRLQSRDIASDKSAVALKLVGEVSGAKTAREAGNIEDAGGYVSGGSGGYGALRNRSTDVRLL